MAAFCEIRTCSLEEINRRFRSAYCLHDQGDNFCETARGNVTENSHLQKSHGLHATIPKYDANRLFITLIGNSDLRSEVFVAVRLQTGVPWAVTWKSCTYVLKHVRYYAVSQCRRPQSKRVCSLHHGIDCSYMCLDYITWIIRARKYTQLLKTSKTINYILSWKIICIQPCRILM
jgi:hypothetical protein